MQPISKEIEDSAWNRIFADSNIRSYAEAAFQLYETLVELEGQGYETLVYPSRGTTPFKHLMRVVHNSEYSSQRGPTRLHHAILKPFGYHTIDLPFTADPPKGSESSSKEIRDYWVRVLKAILDQESESTDLRYFQHCLAEIFGFDRNHGLPLRRSGRQFVFVDTVLSGQAVCEIATAFEAHGLTQFYFVLLVDVGEFNANSDYGKKLANLSSKGMAKLIYVDSLFSEDRGPAMTSTWCLSAPQFVVSAHEVLNVGSTRSLVGTAVSFVRVSADNDLINVSSTVMRSVMNEVIFLALRSLLEVDPYLRRMHDRHLEQGRLELVELAIQKEAQGFNPLLIDETHRIAMRAIQMRKSIAVNRVPIRLPVSDVTVSKSHVVRLFFNDDDVRETLRRFLKNKKPALLSVQDP